MQALEIDAYAAVRADAIAAVGKASTGGLDRTQLLGVARQVGAVELDQQVLDGVVADIGQPLLAQSHGIAAELLEQRVAPLRQGTMQLITLPGFHGSEANASARRGLDQDQTAIRWRRYLDLMKTDRGSLRSRGHQQLLQEPRHDSYKPRRKLRGPAACPDCGAVYRRGRWRWEAAPRVAAAARCPACRRVRDRLPAASVTLRGAFFAEHRDEILARVRNCEAAEKRTHPMQRIMAIAAEGRGVRISTTDAHLARRIGDALRHAYRGELEYRYPKQENLLRVLWSR